MTQDLLRELGPLGFTARLKRLSDALSESIRALYRAEGVDLEPSWHLVLLHLQREGETSMTELASALRLSPPATTRLVERLRERGYVEVRPDAADQRRKRLRLTRRARARLPRFERIWTAGRETVRELLGDDAAFLAGLEDLEAALERQDFAARVLERLEDDA